MTVVRHPGNARPSLPATTGRSVGDMQHDTDARDFLTSRRARLTPEQVGIIGGARRRVTGLRREEVAMLAGVSTDYYVRMERGNLAGVSAEILSAVAGALRLGEAETQHLRDLARAAGPVPLRQHRRPTETRVRPSLQWLLDSITHAPAWIMDNRKNIIAVNALGGALAAPMLEDPSTQANSARFIFLSPASRTYFPDWDQAADSTVASMRVAAGRNPHDKALTDIIGELVTRSDTFRLRWARHDVRFHHAGPKRIVHPVVGDLEFVYEGLDVPGAPDWTMYVYTCAENSPTAQRMRLLGSLTAADPPVPRAPIPLGAAKH